MTATPVRDRVWSSLHEAFEQVAQRHGEPVVLSSLAHDPGVGHPHTRFSFALGPPGRLVAMAVGLRAALPTTPLILVGAADAVTIGTNHLIHAARRNIGMTLVVLRADLFDPAETGLDRAEPRRWGGAAELERRASPLEWASALGATFVARAALHHDGELGELVEQAVAAGGFSVVGVTDDPSLPTGVLSRNEWPEFLDTYRRWSEAFAAGAAPDTASDDGRPAAPAGAPARVEVRVAGLGGQGIKLAGTVLSEAAAAEGLWSTQIGDYGAATRGGASSVDVVFGSDPITYPGADHPDVEVVLSPFAASAAAGRARKIVADDRLTPPDGALVLPLVALAREHTGGQLSTGIVALGAIAAVAGWPSVDALAEAASRKVPGRAVTANVAAMREAYQRTLTAMKENA
jgi:2-oxoglutarate ferredoxin oxidoreductase subunit gamma